MGFTNEGLGFNVPISLFNWGLQMRVKGLHKSMFNISLVGTFFFGGGCVLLAGEMLTFPQFFFENVLLAGEMLKSEKPTFNISPVGAFFGGLCASGWGNVKNFFEKVSSGWGNVKK